MIDRIAPLGLDAELYQVGVVVADIDRGMRDYRALLGLGPFWRLDTDYHARYRDWEGRVANRNAFAWWGDLCLEMIEPCIGLTNAREWLEERGPGIFHLGFMTDDVGQRPDGVQVCFETLDNRQPSGAPQVVHLDTVDRLGYFVELTARPMALGLVRRIETELGRRA